MRVTGVPAASTIARSPIHGPYVGWITSRVGAARGEKVRPQRARVADQPAARTLRIGERLDRELARDRVRVERMHDVEAGLGEQRDQVHAPMMPPPRDRGTVSPCPRASIAS